MDRALDDYVYWMDITIANPDDWKVLREQLATHGGMALDIGSAAVPAPLSTVEVVLRTPDGAAFARAPGQVVHIDPAGQVAFLFHGDARAALMRARYTEQTEGENDGMAMAMDLDIDIDPDTDIDQAAGDDTDDTDDRPLWLRYPEMSKADKIRVARQGNRDARRLVLGDRDQTLHIHMLQNPGLSASEVAGLIRAGGASPPFLQRLAQRSDLMGNQRVVEALVMNPTTPIKLAVALVPRLPLQLVRRIAKTAKLRMPIVKAARKRVIQ